jgi:hypothetical protein
MWDVGWGISDCGLRIAKLGTRPEGGSPQDNWGFKNSILDAGYSMLDKDLLFTTDT